MSCADMDPKLVSRGDLYQFPEQNEYLQHNAAFARFQSFVSQFSEVLSKDAGLYPRFYFILKSLCLWNYPITTSFLVLSSWFFTKKLFDSRIVCWLHVRYCTRSLGTTSFQFLADMWLWARSECRSQEAASISLSFYSPGNVLFLIYEFIL